MLYILTGEEMAALVPRAELVKMAERYDKADLLCEAYDQTAKLLPGATRATFEGCVAELYKQKIAAYEGKAGTAE